MTNNLILTKADRGNTTVILFKHEYNQKILDFLKDNKAVEIQGKKKLKYELEDYRVSNISRLTNLLGRVTRNIPPEILVEQLISNYGHKIS